LSPLEGLNLNSLYIERTKISDVSPLKNLKSLSYLRVQYKSIRDWSPLKDRKDLTIDPGLKGWPHGSN
jgi:Leucine-rich repeat (LRR) protein